MKHTLALPVGLAALTAFSGCRKPAPAPPKVFTATVDAKPQQTLKGWGIYPCTIQLDRPDSANYNIFGRPNAQRLLFNELGISFFRTELLPGSYDGKRDNGSLDAAYLDASLVRWLKLARTYGHSKYILSVWSPPAAFKTPSITRGQLKSVVATLRPEREDDYCRYIVRALDHLTRSRQLPAPFAFSIQNEPDAAPALWNGTVYDGPQWQRVAKKMRAALDAGGYRAVRLIGPEGGTYDATLQRLGGAGLPALKQDPALKAALSGLAYHSYGGGSRLAPYPHDMRDAAATVQSMGKDVWMSEWCVTVPKTPIEHSLRVMQRLARETAYIPSNYWTWWQGWYPQHPKSEVLLTGKDDRHLHISKTYYVLKKLWHSAPAGSVVHRVRTDDPEISGYDPDRVQAVAFVTGARTTILLTNPTAQVKTFSVNGLTGRKATIFRTDETSDMKNVGSPAVTAGRIPLKLPPYTISLVISQ